MQEDPEMLKPELIPWQRGAGREWQLAARAVGAALGCPTTDAAVMVGAESARQPRFSPTAITASSNHKAMQGSHPRHGAGFDPSANLVPVNATPPRMGS